MKWPQMAIRSNSNQGMLKEWKVSVQRDRNTARLLQRGLSGTDATEALSPPPSSWWQSSRLVGRVTNRLQEELRQQDMGPFSTRPAKWWPHHISSFVYSEFGMQVGRGGSWWDQPFTSLLWGRATATILAVRSALASQTEVFDTGSWCITAISSCFACVWKAFYAFSEQCWAFLYLDSSLINVNRLLYETHTNVCIKFMLLFWLKNNGTDTDTKVLLVWGVLIKVDIFSEIIAQLVDYSFSIPTSISLWQLNWWDRFTVETDANIHQFSRPSSSWHKYVFVATKT